MSIDISAIKPSMLVDTSAGTDRVKNGGSDFADILKNAVDGVVQAEATDKANSIALAAGNADNLAAIMIDAEKADLALRLTVQIRNKIIDAYNEIMKMQI